VPGQRFARRYDVKEVLGAGGMGMVYKALDTELGEIVAIKTLKADFASQDAKALERFRSEIRLARKISHRNVVRTHDIGDVDGQYYITMEYAEGKSLKELIRQRGKLPVAAVLTIGKQLCRALEVAHEAGVIHRDIKPQNIILGADGVLKVMDFGIARLAVRKEGVTQAGMVVGTPEYMAPEQLLGDDVDPRVDLYSAGAVLYECLTGRLPHEADSPFTLVAKMLEEDPTPLTTLLPDVPPAVNAAVLSALARNREDRPATAAAFHDLLEASAPAGEAAARRTPRSSAAVPALRG
jgi:serine/threonine protein kinase